MIEVMYNSVRMLTICANVGIRWSVLGADG